MIDKTLGYEFIYDPTHPQANKSGKVYVHRIVAAEKLGRQLFGYEHVHHIDGNRANNSPENLVVLSSSDHARLEQAKRGRIKTFHSCKICGKMSINKTFCSYVCSHLGSRKVKIRPTKQQILNDLKLMSMVKVGKKYGVSDNAVRKWLK